MPGHGFPLFETGIMRPGLGRKLAIVGSYAEIRKDVDPRLCRAAFALGWAAPGDGGMRFFFWDSESPLGDDDSDVLTSDYYPNWRIGRWLKT